MNSIIADIPVNEGVHVPPPPLEYVSVNFIYLIRAVMY